MDIEYLKETGVDANAFGVWFPETDVTHASAIPWHEVWKGGIATTGVRVSIGSTPFACEQPHKVARALFIIAGDWVGSQEEAE